MKFAQHQAIGKPSAIRMCDQVLQRTVVVLLGIRGRDRGKRVTAPGPMPDPGRHALMRGLKSHGRIIVHLKIAPRKKVAQMHVLQSGSIGGQSAPLKRL